MPKAEPLSSYTYEEILDYVKDAVEKYEDQVSAILGLPADDRPLRVVADDIADEGTLAHVTRDDPLIGDTTDVLTIDPRWFQKFFKDGGSFAAADSVIVHELTHIIHQSDGKAPKWIAEGLADYVAGELVGEFASAHGIAKSASTTVERGYSHAVPFIMWMEERWPGAVQKLALGSKEGAYRADSVGLTLRGAPPARPGLVESITGIPEEELITEYERLAKGAGAGLQGLRQLQAREAGHPAPTKEFKGDYRILKRTMRELARQTPVGDANDGPEVKTQTFASDDAPDTVPRAQKPKPPPPSGETDLGPSQQLRLPISEAPVPPGQAGLEPSTSPQDLQIVEARGDAADEVAAQNSAFVEGLAGDNARRGDAIAAVSPVQGPGQMQDEQLVPLSEDEELLVGETDNPMESRFKNTQGKDVPDAVIKAIPALLAAAKQPDAPPALHALIRMLGHYVNSRE